MVKLLYFIRSAFAGLRSNPFVHAVASLTIGVALFATGLARFGSVAVGSVLAAWGSDVEVLLYLQQEVDTEQALALARRITAEDAAQVRLVTADEALQRLREELGEAGAVLTRMPKNPLPATLEIRPAARSRSAEAVAALARKWEALPQVASVEYGREWIERLELLASTVRGAGGLVLAVVLLAAVVVVAATLQLAIFARREEIDIQKLVGATNAFVKAPFLIEGMMQGFFGGSLAALGLWGFQRHFGERAGEGLAFLNGGLPLPPLIDGQGWFDLCAIGVALGLTGSFVAVRRFMRL